MDCPIRLMNIDCDMYESTKDEFDLVGSRVVPGTLIVFDEYIGNPNWGKDEFKPSKKLLSSMDGTMCIL